MNLRDEIKKIQKILRKNATLEGVWVIYLYGGTNQRGAGPDDLKLQKCLEWILVKRPHPP